MAGGRAPAVRGGASDRVGGREGGEGTPLGARARTLRTRTSLSMRRERRRRSSVGICRASAAASGSPSNTRASRSVPETSIPAQSSPALREFCERLKGGGRRGQEEHHRPRIVDVIEAIWGSDEVLVRKDQTTFINLQYSPATHNSAKAYLEALRRLAHSVQKRLEYQNGGGAKA